MFRARWLTRGMSPAKLGNATKCAVLHHREGDGDCLYSRNIQSALPECFPYLYTTHKLSLHIAYSMFSSYITCSQRLVRADYIAAPLSLQNPPSLILVHAQRHVYMNGSITSHHDWKRTVSPGLKWRACLQQFYRAAE